MATCIHCGKSGKKICDTCLKKAKKGKLTFLFPLKHNETITITDACKPKPTPAKVVVSTQTPKSSETAVEKAVPKATVVNEEPKSTIQNKNTAIEVTPVVENLNLEEFLSILNQKRADNQTESTAQKTSDSTTVKQPATATTNTTKKSISDNDDEYTHNDITTETSSGSWGWWIAVTLLIGVVVSVILLPWNIGQWIIGIPIGLLMVFCFLVISPEACLDSEYIGLDVIIYVLTTVNIVFSNLWESGYNTIGFVVSIAIAVSALIVMFCAYGDFENKYGHWAFLCAAINVAFIFWDKIYVYIEPVLTYIKELF